MTIKLFFTIAGFLILFLIILSFDEDEVDVEIRSREMTPLIGDIRLLNPELPACVSREAFRKMLDEAEKGNDIGIAILSNQGKCIKFTNQKVKVVDYKVFSDGALMVQPIDGPYKNQFYWVLEKGTLPVK